MIQKGDLLTNKPLKYSQQARFLQIIHGVCPWHIVLRVSDPGSLPGVAGANIPFTFRKSNANYPLIIINRVITKQLTAIRFGATDSSY